MAELDCNVTAETAEVPGYLVGFAMTVERWVDGTWVELVERDEIEAWWDATWDEHASEAEWSDKAPHRSTPTRKTWKIRMRKRRARSSQCW